MRRTDALTVKSTELAVEAVLYTRYLRKTGLEVPIANQLIRSATAPGALIAEGVESESRADKAHKFSIALKEARETEYWLEVISRVTIVESEQHKPICELLNEVTAILVASINTLRSI